MTTTTDLLKQLQDRLASGGDEIVQDKVSELYALVDKKEPQTPAPASNVSEPACPPAPKKRRRRDPEPTDSEESLKQDSQKKTKASSAKDVPPVTDADYMEYVELSQSFTETGREYRRIGKEKDTLSARIIQDMNQKEVTRYSPEEDVTFKLGVRVRANILTMECVKRVLKEQLEEDLAKRLIKMIEDSKGSTEKEVLTIV